MTGHSLSFVIFAIWPSMVWGATRLMAFKALLRPGRTSSAPDLDPGDRFAGEHRHVHALLPLHLLLELAPEQRRLDAGRGQLDDRDIAPRELHAQ